MERLQIGVIGSAGPEEYRGIKPDDKAYVFAEEIGRLIAEKNAVLVCGGNGGIMEAACRGAKSSNGITVGVVSGNIRGTCNPYVDVEVISGMTNCAEEALIISMSDALIILGGGAGTLQEIATAYRNNKPLVAIDGVEGWGNKLANTYLDYREITKIESMQTAKQAVDWAIQKGRLSSRI